MTKPKKHNNRGRQEQEVQQRRSNARETSYNVSQAFIISMLFLFLSFLFITNYLFLDTSTWISTTTTTIHTTTTKHNNDNRARDASASRAQVSFFSSLFLLLTTFTTRLQLLPPTHHDNERPPPPTMTMMTMGKEEHREDKDGGAQDTFASRAPGMFFKIIFHFLLINIIAWQPQQQHNNPTPCAVATSKQNSTTMCHLKRASTTNGDNHEPHCATSLPCFSKQGFTSTTTPTAPTPLSISFYYLFQWWSTLRWRNAYDRGLNIIWALVI